MLKKFFQHPLTLIITLGVEILNMLVLVGATIADATAKLGSAHALWVFNIVFVVISCLFGGMMFGIVKSKKS